MTKTQFLYHLNMGKSLIVPLVGANLIIEYDDAEKVYLMALFNKKGLANVGFVESEEELVNDNLKSGDGYVLYKIARVVEDGDDITKPIVKEGILDKIAKWYRNWRA